ncbi:MAG: PQQ-binding-like beta-propeller repeat protein [Planctomycetota bacterium]|nr:PQQ-binding-like beta-propeller repeat protein [Planctomycetota bacterium]
MHRHTDGSLKNTSSGPRRCSARLIMILLITGGVTIFSWSAVRGDDDTPAKVQVEQDAKQKQAEAEKQAEAKKNEADQAKEKKGATPKKAIQVPFQNLIKKIFQVPMQPAAPQGNGPDQEGNVDANAPIRDQIDSLAPHDLKQASTMRRIRKWVDLKQWKQALDGLQQILEKPDDSLYRTPDGHWISIRSEAQRLIGTLPIEAQELYRDQYDGLAERLFNDSLRSGNSSGILEVASKFFHTSSGIVAANWLGSYHFQRGEYVLAGRWFERLMTVEAPLTRDPKWLIKAALAWKLAGQEELFTVARDHLESLEPQPISIGGKSDPSYRFRVEDFLLSPVNSGPVSEWKQFLGAPDRAATMVGRDPLLLRRWIQPSTNDSKIVDQINLMYDDLIDEGLSIIPAWFPLAFNGKVVFRTLGGIRVVEAETGHMLWETDARFSPEELIDGAIDQNIMQKQGINLMKVRGRGRINVNMRVGGQFNFMVAQNQYYGNGASHPLLNLLLQDASFGAMSSDGERLFVIEDQAVFSHRQPGTPPWGGDPNDEDPLHRDWTSNKLTAYNLHSGRPLWEVGGVKRDEPFDLSLAGENFLGPPLVDGGELIVIGERDNELRVFGLDPYNGQELWSQLISYINAKIEQDLVRRWWPLHVSSSQGVLVCPTGVGWLLGVDRRQHSLLWAYRYSLPQANPNENRQQLAVADYRPLNARWTPSAPMIVGHRVLFTPSEEPTLVCLNLQDGTLLWQQPKGNFLYLAGVVDDRAILVGTDHVTALSLATGNEVWKTTIDEADGHPCGHGALAGNHFYLPLQSGQLLTIDTTAGTKLSATFLPDGYPLGNLLLYGNQLLSQSPFGVDSFELREPILAELQQRRDQNPDDPWTYLREAEITALSHESETTLEHLHKIDAEKLSADDRVRYDELIRQTLHDLVQSDLKSHDAEFDEFQKLAVTPSERQSATDLALERWIARGELTAALDTLWELMLSKPIVDELTIEGVSTSDNRRARVENLSFDNWLAGQFLDLYQRRNIEFNKVFSARLNEYAATIIAKINADNSENLSSGVISEDDTALCYRYVKLFGFHPAGHQLLEGLARRAIANEEWLEAEQCLMQLTRHGNREQQASAWLQLAEMYQSAGFMPDALACYQRLQGEYAAVKLSMGKTGHEFFTQLADEGKIPLSRPLSDLTWEKNEFQLVRSGAGYWAQQSQSLMFEGGTWPFFNQHRFQIFPSEERLTILGGDNGVFWTLPLRSKSSQNYGSPITGIADGHQLVVNHHDVIHRLSLLDRKILWSWPMEERSGAPGYYQQPVGVQPMLPATQWISRSSLTRRPGFKNPLTIANEQYIGVSHRRGLTMLDARSGAVLWKRSDLSTKSSLFGNSDMLVATTPQGTQMKIFRALDGQMIDDDTLSKQLLHTIKVTERGFLIGHHTGQRGKQGDVTFELYDPIRQRAIWTRSIPAASHVAQDTATTMNILHADGEINSLNLETGELTVVGKIAGREENKPNPEVYVFSDAYLTYAISNNRQGNIFHADSMPAMRANGIFHAFRPGSTEPIWTKEINNQNLCLESLGESPILVFLGREYKREGNIGGYWETRLTAVDKSGGATLIDSSLPTTTGFHQLKIDSQTQTAELRSYNELLRIQPVEAQAAK